MKNEACKDIYSQIETPYLAITDEVTRRAQQCANESRRH
jgi:hypothetical protein